MKIKEKKYIFKCSCGSEIIFSLKDCYYHKPSNCYYLTCPVCEEQYDDRFDKNIFKNEYIEKDKEIERLKIENEILKQDVERLKSQNELLDVLYTKEYLEKLKLKELKGSD